MADMTDAEWARFGDYVPWITDRAAVQVRVDDLGSWHAAALAYTRKLLGEHLSEPSSFSVPEYSESWTTNITELRKNMTELEGLVPADEGGASFSVGQMHRHGRDRRAGYR